MFVVTPFFLRHEGEGDVVMLLYALVLSPVSAILVSFDRRHRATAMFWIPLVLFFCVLALPAYMFARRENSARIQT
jgi:hypothetical protein